MLRLKIAIISDIHAGRDARPAEFREAYAGGGSYLSHFNDLVCQEGIMADYLVIPGDLTHTGQHEEARTASSVVGELCRSLKLSKDRVILVPGNHDVNRQVKLVGSPNDRRFWHRMQFAALSDQDFADRLINTPYDLCAAPHLAIWDTSDVDFVVYNSAAFEDEDSSMPRHGVVEPRTICAH